MADRTIKILTAATTHDLLTLEEAKLRLGIPSTDTTNDDLITEMISTYSAMAAEICNRTFAKEKVTETWRDMDDGRLFLSHWPIKATDVEAITAGGAPYDVVDIELEEHSGKLSFIANGGASSEPWPAPAVVTYTGGYDLPDEAPKPLKQAVAIMIRDERMKMQQASVAGIRQISHKESRVSFFDPNAMQLQSVLGKLRS